MIDSLHIDDFCRDVAKVLRNLYKQFPNKSVLYVEDICGPDTPDEFGLHSPRFESAFSAVVWMKNSGIIEYASPIQREAFEHTCLTLKGFNLLHTNVNVIGTQSLSLRIHELSQCLKEGSSSQLTELVVSYLAKLN